MSRIFIFLVCFFISNEIIAKNWSQDNKKISLLIHSTYIYPASKTIQVQATFWLGNGDEKNCTVIEKASSTILDVEPPWRLALNLDGVWLAYQFGLQYTCAEEVYVVPVLQKKYIVQYALKNDGIFYNGSVPAKAEIHLYPKTRDREHL